LDGKKTNDENLGAKIDRDRGEELEFRKNEDLYSLRGKSKSGAIFIQNLRREGEVAAGLEN